MSQKNLFFKSAVLSNSKFVSGNFLFEAGTLFPVKLERVSKKPPQIKENNLPVKSDYLSDKLSVVDENILSLKKNIVSDYLVPDNDNNSTETEAENPILLERIYDIFYKQLDEDKKKKFVRNIEPGISNFILKYVKENDISVLYKTDNKSVIENGQKKNRNFINLLRINKLRYINKFFESVNKNLAQDGIFIGCVETFVQRKKRIFKKYPAVIAYPYYALDFIFKRAFPKICLTKKLYYLITKGKSRLLSLPETLGRLVSCGFDILGYEEINNQTYFAVKRTGEPVFDKKPSYGFFIRLKRIGKDGKIINVYKCRTMHPYSEYLQEYIWKNNSLKAGGKFKEDFRITPWGRVLRKYRLDELPMLWNFIKRDLKLFGVRPLSSQYYNLYEEDIRERRIKYKPGLVPPFFADLPKTFSEILDSERRYLDSFEKHPFRTDWKYFWKVLYNINIKHAMGE